MERPFGAKTFEQEKGRFLKQARSLANLDRIRRNAPVRHRVCKDLALFRDASDEVRSDKEVASVVLPHWPHCIQYCSEALRNDKDVVLLTVTHKLTDIATIREVPDAHFFYMQDQDPLQYASEDLRNDSVVVSAAVSRRPRSLEHASATCRNDKEIVLAALAGDGGVLHLASDDLRNDPKVVLVAVSMQPDSLRHASGTCRNDKQIVLAAVTRNGFVLQYASDDLRDDPDIVSAAVSVNGLALRHASAGCRDDPTCVAAAIRQEPSSLQFGSESIRKNRAFLLNVDLEKKCGLLRFIHRELLGDKDFMVLLARQQRLRNVKDEDSPCHSQDFMVLLGLPQRLGTGKEEYYRFHSQAVGGLVSSAEEFWDAVEASLAVPGETATVVSVRLARVTEAGVELYQCEVQLMSGTSFQCQIPAAIEVPQPVRHWWWWWDDGRFPSRPPSTREAKVDDLASAIQSELRQHTEAASKHVFIVFKKEEGDDIPVNAWDSQRPLHEFLAIP